MPGRQQRVTQSGGGGRGRKNLADPVQDTRIFEDVFMAASPSLHLHLRSTICCVTRCSTSSTVVGAIKRGPFTRVAGLDGQLQVGRRNLMLRAKHADNSGSTFAAYSHTSRVNKWTTAHAYGCSCMLACMYCFVARCYTACSACPCDSVSSGSSSFLLH